MSSETSRLVDNCRPKLAKSLDLRKNTAIEFRKTRTIPPTIDSGWAWAVLGGSCLSNFILWGFTSSIGILYVPIQASVHMDMNSVSWIGTLLNGGMLVLVPMMSPLSESIGCRKLCMLGGLLIALSMVTSFFGTSLLILYIFVGAIPGLGASLIYTSVVLVCNHYFVKSRAMAMSACMTSAGLGTMVYGYLQTFLIDQFGLQGTLLIHGGIFLHVCVGGQLFFPNGGIIKESKTNYDSVPKAKRNMVAQNTDFQFNTNITALRQDSFHQSTSSFQSDIRFMDSLALSIDVIAENNNYEPFGEDAYMKDTTRKSFLDVFRSYADPTLWKSPGFFILIVTYFLFNYGFYTLAMFLPDYVFTQGIPFDTIPLLTAEIGIVSTINRFIITGCIGRFPGWIGRVSVLYLIIMTISTCFLPLVTDLNGYLVTCAGYGISSGPILCLYPVLLVDSIGPQRLAAGFGVLCFADGLGTICCTLGRNIFSSSPGMAFYVAGGSSGLAAILLLYSIWPKRAESTERKQLLDNMEGSNWRDELVTEILVDPVPYLSPEIHAKVIV